MRIQTLGGLRAFIGDEPLSLPPSRQSRALLAYLACSSRPLHRAGLCELLWENTPEPRAALRWCLSRLRPVLDAGGVPRLVAEADTLWLSPENCEVDGKRLRELAVAVVEAGTGELEAAVTGLAGSFLADLEFADAMRFESWRVAEEKSLAQARAAIFGELLRRHQGNPEAAVRVGHLWVQQDPFESRAHIAIIVALSALGRKREALAHYERCAQMLRNHGGGVPAALEKARASVGRIGQAASEPPSQALGNTPVSHPAGSASAAARSPMAGRAREMQAFARILSEAAFPVPAEAGRMASGDFPGARLHLLSGEPGIGKTRLLEEMGDQLASRGWIRLKGRAFEAERGRAFGPWIDASWALAAERPEAVADCPLLHPSSAPERGPADPSALFESVRRWLGALAESAPLALILDDLHWLDPSSAALLQYLMRGPACPFRILLAGIRSVAATQDAAVEAFLRLARREGWIETWDIGPLSAADTADLLRRVGSRRDPEEVFAMGAGHPLASLALAQEDGEAARGRRESLEAMLDERIRLAGDEGRGILQWAALMGRGLPPALLENLTDLSVHALLSALERLEGQGLVKVEEGKAGMEYLFGHDLIRQRVKEGLSAPRLKRMHGHVAQVLKAQPALSRGSEEVAQHAELGGDWRLAAEACLEAGHQCVRLKAYDTVAALALRAFDLAWKLDGHWVLHQEICFLVNTVFNCLAKFPEGMDQALLRLAQEAREAGQDETVVAALTALTTLRFEQGRPADVLQAVQDVTRTMGDSVEPGLRVMTLADMALCLIVTDQEIPRARRLLAESEEVGRTYGVHSPILDAARSALLFRDGRIDEARASVVASRVGIETMPYPGLLHFALADQAMMELAAGDPEAAIAVTDRMRALEKDVRHKADVHFPDALKAMALRQLGDPGAEALYLDVLERLRGRNTKVMTSHLLLFWSERDLREGRLDGIAANCREVIDRCRPLGRISETSAAQCLLGLLAVKEGRRADAEALSSEVEKELLLPTPPPARVFRLAEELKAALETAPGLKTAFLG